MNEPSKCNRCGAPLPPDSPEGLCPRCLIALNLATQTEITGEPSHAKPPPTPPLPVSDVAKLFPQLEILECLGRGGMGAVYKARQPRLDRVVALKILSPEKQGNQKFAERFEREARALAKLHHPNIVTVYDFGETQGNFYLLMEFVDGLTLRQLFQNRKLSPPEALAIVPKICDALQYAHSQGIVHRDIKPENILMDKEGHVKIADFGIAKILGDGERDNLTEAQAIGTPHYMSPEQIEKPKAVDHRADIYSLGVVFYEMLTGELPLGKFQPPSKKVQVDVRLDEIVLRALEKEPERRYQQAKEVKTHVETVAATSQQNRDREGAARRRPAGIWNWTAVTVRVAAGFILLAFLGLLAAIIIRHHTQELQKQQLESKSDYIGQTWFPGGDSIQITSVQRTTNEMTVSGRYRLASHDAARLALYTTSTNSGVPAGSNQVIMIYKGNGDSYDFTLADPHIGRGLPHLSMYDTDNGHPFASLYFGTKEEAAEESQADWITNETPASALTWSPKLAPGEKPDFNKILNEAPTLTSEGSYEDALQRLLWYFDHTRNDTASGQTGVRLSFALSDWIELGQRYPKAKQALIEIRDADIRQVSQTGGYQDLFQEIDSINQYLGDDDGRLALFKAIEQRRKTHPGERGGLPSRLFDWIELARHYPKAMQALIELRDDDTRQFSENTGFAELFQQVDSINQYLGDDDATIALFKTIEQHDPQLAQQCFFYAESTLVQQGDYAICRKHLGEPQAAFDRLRQQWQQMKQFEQENTDRMEENKKHFQAMAKSNSIFAHISLPSPPPPFADNNFVAQTRQLILILVATGSKSDAENIQTQALSDLNDPRLKSAVKDAEAKISGRAEAAQKNQANRTANPQPDSVNTNRPQVVSVWPTDGAINVETRQTIRIRFSQPMNPNALEIMWMSGGFLAAEPAHYDSNNNEFNIPMQLVPGKTIKLQVGWAGEGFRDTNGNPTKEFTWQFSTKPFVPKPGTPRPILVQISPPAGETLPVLTLFQLTFDQPMSLDHGFPYLRTEGFDLPALLPDFDYDPTAHRFTIPVILPPDNETKLTLHGFYSADGVAADPVVIRCEIGTNNYSDEQLIHFSKAAQDPRLKQLLTSMKTARAQYTSGIETVQTVSLNTEGPVYSMLSASQALFKWEGTNRFYEDISDIMNIKAFILGTDGNACWMYGNQEKEGHRLDTCPAASVDIHMSVADPFNLTRRSVESAIAKGKLVYEGQSQLGGRLCYRVGTWYARQTGHDVFSVQAGKFEWWIDAKTFLLLRLVQHRSGGEDTLTFDYQELNQPLPDSAFQPPIASGPGVVSDDWFNKKLGPGEIRFLTIKDGSSGTMSGRIGRQGPNGSTDAGLN